MQEIAREIERWRADGQEVVVATLISTYGSSPRPLGSKLAVSSTGAVAGSVSGGCVEGAVIEEANGVFADGTPKRLRYGISDETAWSVGLTCGGEIEVFLEKL